MVCGRPRMYRVSQSTRGHDIDSQARVTFEAVWHHVGSSIAAGAGGLISSKAFETARLAREAAPDGDAPKSGGAGDAVELRDRGVFLVGDGSEVGKSP